MRLIRTALLASMAVLTAALPAQAADRLVLQLKWTTNVEFAGYLVADAKGFYRDEGLDVAINQGGPGFAGEEIIRQGGADVLVASLGTAFVMRAHGLDLVNIAQIFTGAALSLVCRRDSGIKDLADLRGKVIGEYDDRRRPVWRALANIAKLLKPDGSPAFQVKSQRYSLETLQDGAVACLPVMAYNEPWELNQRGLPFAKQILFNLHDAGVWPAEDGLWVRADLLADPAGADRLTRFLRATLRGWRYVISHPDEAVELSIAGNPVGGLDDSQQAFQLNYEIKHLLNNPKGLGYLDPAKVDQAVAAFRERQVDYSAIAKGAWTHKIWQQATQP